jgi:hypothetical protein
MQTGLPHRLAIITACLIALMGYSAAEAAQLPQDHPWQVVLRDYLQSLQARDFAIDKTTWTLEEDYAKAGPEKLYRDWIILGNPSRLPSNAQFFADPRAFTLEQIERADGIYCIPNPAGMAWWTQLQIQGNPFYGSQPARRRALVSAIVDMIMLESAWEDPRNLLAMFMGANLGTWAYTYRHGRDLLPEKAQKAYEEGMRFYLTQMERLAPTDGNTNMDMRELATLATLARVFRDPPTQKRLVDDARRILFGDPSRGPATSDPRRGTFHPAGYIGEEDGPETSYNGISLFHLLEAALTSHGDPAWDAFLPEVIERMLRFKAYNTFPEPDGRWEGPSSWATRTNDPYPRDQRNRPWRRKASAMLSAEGLYLLRVDPKTYEGNAPGIASPEVMLREIRQGVVRLNRRVIKGEGRARGLEAVVWQEDHWPADIPFTWDDYLDGSHARFTKLIAQRSELLLPPFARSGDFSVNFDGEFWVAKRSAWGFQVEAVPHMSRGYNQGGSGALAGGSLAAFWTKPTGLVILGRLPDKWNYVTWRPREGVKEEHRWSVDRWTTHHLWGRTKEGRAFSSARQRHPWVSYELEGEIPTVRALGWLGGRDTVEEPGTLKDDGHVAYRRTFAQLPQGLRVTSELLSRGEDAFGHRGTEEDRRDYLVELWENLPLYYDRVDRRRTKGVTPTIEYRVGGHWQKATTKLTAGVEAVRITRHGHPVVIEFDQPQRVDLADEVTQTSYQSQDRIHNLRVDLLGSDGRAKIMPKRARVSYLIRPGE